MAYELLTKRMLNLKKLLLLMNWWNLIKCLLLNEESCIIYKIQIRFIRSEYRNI